MSEAISVRLGSAGEVIAAVPAMLGFHPDNSLVLILLNGQRLALTARLDLPLKQHVPEWADHVMSTLIRSEVEADNALAVVVGAEPREDVTRALGDALADRLYVELRSALWTTSTKLGGEWRTFDGQHSGLVEEAETSTLALAQSQVRGSRPIRANRRTLVASLAQVVDEETATRRRAMIETGGYPPSVKAVTTALHDQETGTLALDDDTVALLARCLTDPGVRDACIGWLMQESALAAHELWLALIRQIPAPYVADVAALLALSALCLGNGAIADAALKRAHEANTEHRLAQIVRGMHSIGINPAEVKRAVAQDVGLTTPCT